MDWTNIGQIAVTAIISAGGIGGIIIAVVKFSADKIAERMNEKFKASLSMELEKYKSELTKKEYVSKTRFETEFQIYRELSGAFFDLVRGVNSIIAYGYHTVPADENDRKQYDDENYIKTRKLLVDAQDLLQKNAPFITESLYDSFDEILKLSRMQVSVIEERYNVGNFFKDKGVPKTEDYQRTKEILDKHQALQKELRDYLAKLEVAE